MIAKDFSRKIIIPNKYQDMDHKKELVDYIYRSLSSIMRDPGRFIPDEIYTDTPGEMVVHLPFDGAAYVEVNTETYLLEK